MKFRIALYLLCIMQITPVSSARAADTTSAHTVVMVTLPPLAGISKLLLPDIAPQCLLPAHADPHHFQLTPRQMMRLRQASLLIRSPTDDKAWVNFTHQASNMVLWQPADNTHTQGHAWLNPEAVASFLPELARQLQQALPKETQTIQRQLPLARQQAQTVWQAWQDLVHTYKLKQRGVVMQHPSWAGLFAALGVPVRAVLESAQHGQEFGPRKLERALNILRQHPDTLLIADARHSNRALMWLRARHPASQMAKLDALGQCDTPWQALMRQNIDALKAALKP